MKKIDVTKIIKNIKAFIKDSIWVIKNRNNQDAESLFYKYAKQCEANTISRAFVCDKIREAYGNRSMVIYHAKQKGWWYQPDATTCYELIKSPGNTAMAIAYAFKEPWWLYNVEVTCRCILKAPGDVAFAIYNAKQEGWWCYDNETTSKQITEALLNKPSQLNNIPMYKNTNWWVESIT